MRPVIMDMLQGTGRRLGRAAVACACAGALAASGPAQAKKPEGPAPAGPPTEELNALAEKEAIKAVEHFNNGAYGDAEASFKRLAYFAPNWRPLHFNLGVVAEAQGKIGTAVTEYKKFRPLGSPEEQMLVDQRIDELSQRRGNVSGAYKRQIALSATALTLGVGGIAGGAVLVAFTFRNGNKADELNKQADAFEAMMMPTEAMSLRDEAAALDKKKGPYLYGGVYLLIFGLLAAAYSVIPLRNAVRSKRQLDGLALGPTRLKWNGGAGVRLHF